jgi:hypothetical protein
MTTQKHLRTGAIAAICLGCIHTMATPIIFSGLKFLPTNTFLAMLCVFLMAGFAVLATGLLQLFLIKRLHIHNDFQSLQKGSIVFLIIFGVGAVASMWTNPFAYISLLLALYEAFYFRKYLKQTNSQVSQTRYNL